MVLSIRNNNAGNLRPVGAVEGFQGFSTPEEGLDAMRRDLLVKISGQSKAMAGRFGEGYEPTLANIISTWAPESENDTQNYINFVAERSGINPNERLTPERIDAFMPAMVEMEGGREAVDHFYGGDTLKGEQGEVDLNEYIQVEAPGGQILEFPSSMSQDEILNIMREKFPPQVEQGQPVAEVQGNNAGAGNAFAYGVSGGALPFGNRITSGIGAGLATAYDALGGSDADLSFGEYYKQALADTRSTQEANPKATVAGNITGIASSLPLASARVIGGGQAATTGLRGIINAIPKGLSKVYDFARSGKAARDASLLAKSGSLALRGAKGAVVAAPTAGLYTAGEAESGQQWSAFKGGALVGGAIGFGMPVAGAGLGLASSAVIPKVDDAVAPLAKRARDFGISLRADQIAPTRARNTVQKISQALPFSGVDDFERLQRSQWTKAVAKTIGQESDDLNPEVIQKFLRETGDAYDDVLKGKELTFNRLDRGVIDNIIIDAENTLDEGLAKVVRKNAESLLRDLSVDGIKGEKVSSIRSELLKRSTRAQGGAKEYLGDLVELIDGVVEDALPESSSKILKDVRRKYRNFKTIEPLLEKGEINPTQLMQQVASSKYIKSSRASLGDDDLVDLARIGKQLLVKKGGSDTFEKGAYALKGGSQLGNLGTGAAAIADMGVTASALVGNRGLQKLNSSQRLIDMAIKPAKPLAGKITNKSASGVTNGIANRSPLFLDN